MQQHGLVHPGMMAKLRANFYPSLCTFYAANGTINSVGEEVNAPLAIAGLEDIPCRFASKTAQDVRELQQTYAESTYHLALNGYYPSVTSTMLVTVDGTLYEIDGQPQHDGNDKTTRIYLREVDP